MEKTKLITKVLAASALVTLLVACVDRPIDRPPGRYESNQSATDSNGTTYERQDSSKVGYDAKGNKTAVTQTKTSRDPPGLLNKTTTKTQETIEQEKQ